MSVAEKSLRNEILDIKGLMERLSKIEDELFDIAEQQLILARIFPEYRNLPPGEAISILRNLERKKG